MTADEGPNAQTAGPGPGDGDGSKNGAVGAAGLREPLLTFLVVTGLAAALFWIGRVVPFVYQNLHGLIAVLFLYAPWAAVRVSGVPFDYREAGLRLAPIRRGLFTLGLVIAITWPPFIAGFFVFYGRICSAASSVSIAGWLEVFAPVCPRWLGFENTPLRLPPGFLTLALSQLVVVALPEEMFFRGYLYQRLERVWPARRVLLGAPVGWAVPVTSALFALGHVLVDLDPRRFAVFFPGLIFAWMRARTGSIVAGATYHAACNLLSDILYETYFS